MSWLPEPLRIPDFRSLWLARLATTIAQMAMVIVIGWQVYDIARATMPIREAAFQLGLVGLVVSGTFLHPELGSSLTVIKLAAVLLISIVGVLTLATKRQMMRQAFAIPRGLLLRGMILAAASQSLWWTAVVIGFVNAQS